MTMNSTPPLQQPCFSHKHASRSLTHLAHTSAHIHTQSGLEGLPAAANGAGAAAAGANGQSAGEQQTHNGRSGVQIVKRPGRANVLKRYVQRGLWGCAQEVFLPMQLFRCVRVCVCFGGVFLGWWLLGRREWRVGGVFLPMQQFRCVRVRVYGRGWLRCLGGREFRREVAGWGVQWSGVFALVVCSMTLAFCNCVPVPSLSLTHAHTPCLCLTTTTTTTLTHCNRCSENVQKQVLDNAPPDPDSVPEEWADDQVGVFVCGGGVDAS